MAEIDSFNSILNSEINDQIYYHSELVDRGEHLKNIDRIIRSEISEDWINHFKDLSADQLDEFAGLVYKALFSTPYRIVTFDLLEQSGVLLVEAHRYFLGIFPVAGKGRIQVDTYENFLHVGKRYIVIVI